MTRNSSPTSGSFAERLDAGGQFVGECQREAYPRTSRKAPLAHLRTHGATLDELREARTTLEDVERTARRACSVARIRA